MIHFERAGIALGTLLALAGGALAQDDDLRREVEDLRRLVEEQAKRIDELSANGGADASELDAAISRHLAAMKDGETGTLRFPTLTKKGSVFSLYGFIRADAIYNDSRVGINNEIIGFAMSEDPSAPVGVGAGGRDEDDFTIHPRLTRLGLDFNGGKAKTIDANVTGVVEVDFYEGGSESRARLRMRKAYVNLAWDDIQVLAGQTTDLIAPLYASINSDLAMWGAGNLGDRRPQIRVTYTRAMGGATWEFAGMAGQTGAIDGQNLDGTGAYGSAISDGSKSAGPTWQGRVAYKRTLEPGKLEVGAWIHHATEDPDARIGTRGDDTLSSSAWGVDVQVPLVKDLLWLKGEWFTGRNLDDVRGGIFQGINTTTGEEIHTDGGFAELGVRATPWMTWHVGFSRDDPDDHDLNTGGRGKNEVKWIATRMSFDPVVIGIEYLDWKTEYVGYGDGDVRRIALYIEYHL